MYAYAHKMLWKNPKEVFGQSYLTELLCYTSRNLEEEMATHSSILAYKIPWTEEPGGLQSIGLQTFRHD